MASTLFSRSFLAASHHFILLSKRGSYSQLGSSSTTWARRAMTSIGVGNKTGYSTSVSTTEPVVSVDWLHSNLRKPDLKVLDASQYIPAEQKNPIREYQVAHIHGALFFDLEGISDCDTSLPSEEAFGARCSALRIENKDGVVVYDAKGMFSAARVWWMFKVFGHDKVWVLDGGLPRWRASGYHVESSGSGDACQAIDKVYQGQTVSPIAFKTKFQPHLVWTLDPHLPTKSHHTRFFGLSENRQPMGEVAEKAHGFNLTTTKNQVIKAGLPLQDHWLPLSNLDLLLPLLHACGSFCYKKPLNMTNSVALEILKTSLAKTLVYYYAFAGEIVTNPTGEPEILCNNRGVDFLEASADVELRELNLYDPDESLTKLVPILKNGVLSIQVTQLKCGSIVVGFTFDHRVADAYSINMFLLSWAEISRSDVPITFVPTFRRSLLNPRRPLIVNSSIDQIYMPVTSLPPPQEIINPDHIFESRIFYIKADALAELQNLASSSKYGKKTKVESFSAFLWKLVAAHTAKDPVLSKNSILGILIDGRKKLLEKENYSYFGNVLSVSYGDQKTDDLINKPLSWVAEQVHRFLESSNTKEHFLNLIDFIESQRPTPAVSRMYTTGFNNRSTFGFSSGRNLAVTEIDFGWGAPVFGSYHFPWGGNCGYVLVMPSSVVGGDWIVYLRLTKGQLKFIEEEASHVLKPIDNDYLKI